MIQLVPSLQVQGGNSPFIRLVIALVRDPSPKWNEIFFSNACAPAWQLPFTPSPSWRFFETVCQCPSAGRFSIFFNKRYSFLFSYLGIKFSYDASIKRTKQNIWFGSFNTHICWELHDPLSIRTNALFFVGKIIILSWIDTEDYGVQLTSVGIINCFGWTSLPALLTYLTFWLASSTEDIINQETLEARNKPVASHTYSFICKHIHVDFVMPTTV